MRDRRNINKNNWNTTHENNTIHYGLQQLPTIFFSVFILNLILSH
jgi:hypothetical protein